MITLLWIIGSCLAGGLIGLLMVWSVSLAIKPQHISLLVAYAIGALLGAALLEVLPQALETGNPKTVTTTLLFGIMLFFILEKLVIWRHCHHAQCEGHIPNHTHGRAGILVVLGDTVHNFVDGILIAAAFIQSHELGVITALAIIAHEVPQELGDYTVLIHSGYARRSALLLNALSSLAMLVGGVAAWFILGSLQSSIPTLLAFAAASMLYVAVADLIPGLHQRSEAMVSIQQIIVISLGILSIAVVGNWLHGH